MRAKGASTVTSSCPCGSDFLRGFSRSKHNQYRKLFGDGMEVMCDLRRYVNHATRRYFRIHAGDRDFASTGNHVKSPRLIEGTRKNSL